MLPGTGYRHATTKRTLNILIKCELPAKTLAFSGLDRLEEGLLISRVHLIPRPLLLKEKRRNT
jgi:hypothetical protein